MTAYAAAVDAVSESTVAPAKVPASPVEAMRPACNHATESKAIHPARTLRTGLVDTVQKNAEEFGISDRGLAKICARHCVPSPPRGYWARLVAGQKIRQPILPTVKDPWLDRIEISSTISTLPDATREMLKQAKAKRAPTRCAVEGINTMVQDGTIEMPHKAIAPTARALRKGKPDEFGSVSATAPGMCGVAVHPDRVERAITFLHNLATLLEADALHLEPQGERMKLRSVLTT